MWSKTFANAAEIIDADFSSKPCSPSLILLFGPTEELANSSTPMLLQEKFPNAIVSGCSAGTAFSDKNVTDSSIVGIVIGFEKTRLIYASDTVSSPRESFNIGARLGLQLKEPDLAGVYIISDGLSVNGSDIVGGVLSVLGGRIPVSGGLAGDGARFEKTLVIEKGRPYEKRVIAIGLYGNDLKIAYGSDGGWEDFGETWTVTKSEANVMTELNKESAFEVYASQLGAERKNLPASGLLFPLRIWHPSYPEHDIVRTLLAVDETAGSLTFAGDVPQGWNARLMRATNNMLVGGASQSAQQALDAFKEMTSGQDPIIALGVSCVGRRLLMGEETQREISQVKELLPNTQFVGFHSYGEIAPHKKTKLCSLHNQTMTLTLMSEA